MQQELQSGLACTHLQAEHFKTSRVSVHFIMPSRRETATLYALLPLVMARGCALYPDMTQLSRALARLYGASLSADSSVQGENRVVSFSLSFIRDEYALEKEALSSSCSGLLGEIAFRPYLPGGAFDPQAVEVEKRKLQEQLEGEINNKRAYCIRQARRRFFGDAPAGIERNGYLEDLKDVTPQRLAQAFREMLRSARIQLFTVGLDPADQLQAAENCAGAYGGALPGPAAGQPAGILPAVAMPLTELRSYAQPVDAVQGKLCLIFTPGRVLTPWQRDRVRLGVAIFGGLPSSRLFRNVREKQSLCYYCSASFASLTSALYVDSGVEPADAGRARQAILQELARLVEKPIPAQELEQAKRWYLGALQAVGDSLSSIELWNFQGLMIGDGASPAQVAQRIGQIKEEEIRQVLGLFAPSVSYLLAKGVKEDG